ncbi:MAG: MBL fold metallo-hydrolase [Vicinamibacteria bacterium]
MPDFHISVLGSGSTGNVTFVSDGSVRLLLDAGLACKETEKRLRLFGIAPRNIDGVLVSHEHGDHARGAWRFCSRHRVPLYATEGTFLLMPRLEGKPVEWVRVRSGSSFKLGRLTVDLFRTPHDASDPVGFRLRRGRLAFGHVTDIGHVSEEVASGLRGCDAILIESNHDVEMLRAGEYPDSLKDRVGSRWGHLSNDALAHYLQHRLPDAVRHLFLAHLSLQNNHESLALECCREALRRRGGRLPKVHLTFADRPTPMLRISEAKPLLMEERAQGVLLFESCCHAD